MSRRKEFPGFPAVLRQLRESRGWSCRDLADRAGITYGTVSHLETGRYEPKHSTIAALARALEVGPETFFEKTV